ncbi:MAG: tRNA pseudouridine(55) synthase TruB [Anaerolineae bacterium]|nr:tRNA pseudouridine(55) synthase TruB [Anaerolineae bacterium]
MSGILNIDKPAGMTSHDVVDRVRRISGQRRVGHAGTLDPAATGVLVVCLGQATRVAEYLMASDKVYRAQIRLGVSTDTHDAEGEVTATAEVDVGEEEVREALASFVGSIQQVPPMYSALKREGVPLYKLARRGITVEREPRSVEIHDIELLQWTPSLFTIRVECSPGTYIRALARDLGQELGCGAHLHRLTRLASGHFTLEKAVRLDELAEAFAYFDGAQYRQGDWQGFIHPLDEALLDFGPIVVDAQTEKLIRHGQQVEAPPFAPPDCGGGEKEEFYRAYSQKGELIAILRHDPQTGLWQPKKVFKLEIRN